jgi:hypothetical protein
MREDGVFTLRSRHRGSLGLPLRSVATIAFSVVIRRTLSTAGGLVAGCLRPTYRYYYLRAS